MTDVSGTGQVLRYTPQAIGQSSYTSPVDYSQGGVPSALKTGSTIAGSLLLGPIGGAAIAGVTSIISGIMNYYGAKKQADETRAYNNMMLEQAGIERGIQQRQFGAQLGLSKKEIKLAERKQKFTEAEAAKDRKYKAEVDRYNKMVNFADNLKGYLTYNPAFSKRMMEIQQQRAV